MTDLKPALKVLGILGLFSGGYMNYHVYRFGVSGEVIPLGVIAFAGIFAIGLLLVEDDIDWL